MNTYRLWPMLPPRSIPRYLEHMEQNHGLRFTGLTCLFLFAKYQRISPEEATSYDVDYFKPSSFWKIQDFFDLCEASGWEPVLQQQRYKIFRSKTSDAIPLYEESERREHWRKQSRGQLLPSLFTLLLLFNCIYFVSQSLERELPFFLYLTPGFYQMFLGLLVLLFVYGMGTSIFDLFSLIILWDHPLPSYFFGLGILIRLLVYLSTVLVPVTGLLAAWLENYSTGSLYGVLIGIPIGSYIRYISCQEDFPKGKMKGYFAPTGKVALALTILIPGLSICALVAQLHFLSLPVDEDNSSWVNSSNYYCSQIVYPYYNKNDLAFYHLRSPVELDGLKDALIESSYFTFLTEEQLASSNDLPEQELIPHLKAISALQEDSSVKEVQINQIGTLYLVVADDKVYRLKSPLGFFDEGYSSDEEDIEEIARKIEESIRSQMVQMETIANSK